MNLPEADKLTRRSIRRIEHFKGKPGSKMTEAKSCASASLFGTTALKSNAKHVSINEKQFLQSLADNMRQRLLTTAAVVAQSTSATGSTQECESQGKLIIAQLSVINPEYWPNEMDANYGEEEVRLLCQRFRLSYATVRDAYCDFKDSGGQQITRKFKALLNCINTIPVSTAECERGFSAMNVILSDTRSSLLITHVSGLMFIRMHGPPLEVWKPHQYIRSWLRKHRSATDTRLTRVASETSAAEMKTPDLLWTIFYRLYCRLMHCALRT